MSAPIRFAILGCGRVSKKHLDALSREVEGAQLAAVCDIKLDRAEKAGAEYNVPYYSNLDEMLKKHPEIEVVNILTPSGLHAKHCLQVAQHRRHVVVEKPMALLMDDAEAMIRECARQGVRLFVVKQNRYNLPVQQLQRALQEGRFGKMVLGSVRVRWCRTQEYYDSDDWRGTWAMDGGVMTNQAAHHVDLLIWAMGQVESVFAYSATRLVDIEVDDTTVAVLKFTNGALGVIETTTATRPKDLEGSISILGEKGTVEIGGFAVNEMKVWNFADVRPEDKEVLSKYRENPPNVYGFGHQRFLSEVVAALKGESLGVVDGLEGMKTLEVVNAIYESMESGQEVRLRFRPKRSRLGETARA